MFTFFTKLARIQPLYLLRCLPFASSDITVPFQCGIAIKCTNKGYGHFPTRFGFTVHEKNFCFVGCAHGLGIPGCLSHSIRWKSKKARNSKRSKEADELTEDEDTDDEEAQTLETGPGFKDVRLRVGSLRLDAILKAGLGISRNKIEEAFYGSKIRVNGSKVLKKSVMLHEGDEIDFIRETKMDTGLVEVSRLELRKIGDYDEDSDRFPVLCRKYTSLLLKGSDL